ncbi:acyltransferase family protein [Phenylobacterium deserti]|uniref:Acyltransferase 3 domain-containing protein n=1 Tax=Phenylobacterium deserti TaxID=1914756 RepID=A0A328AFE4_9CAUL|nr:acyltransferase [Phenylobacterium deserti]RAK52134.1 hypothetical protein DJ018_13340 [Phenylobacterium deserti]
MSAREVDLDVVRGFAILLAVGWHFNEVTGSLPIDVLLAPGRMFGWAGVDLFFVLSGFLVGRLILAESLATGRFSAGRFFIRRAFKLWPVLYTFLLAMLVLSDRSWAELLPAALHVRNYAPEGAVNQLWSLSVEEHFYLAVGLLLPILAARLRGDLRIMAWALIGICVASPVLRVIGAALGAGAHALQWQTQYRLDGLSLGVLLAVVAVRWPATFDRLVSKKRVHAALAAAGTAFLIAWPKSSVVGSTIGYSVTAIWAAAILLLTYRSGVERWARWPARGLAFLGVYSYALYVWHIAAKGVVDKLAAATHIAIPAPALVCVRYAAAVGVAYAVTRLVERPSLWLRDRVAPRVNSQRPAPTSAAVTTAPAGV